LFVPTSILDIGGYNLENFSKRHATICENVKMLVEAHPEVKSDYRLLIQYYHYYIDGLAKYVPLTVLKQLTQPESISRAYRRLVADKAVKPDPLTNGARRREQKLYKTYYGRVKHEALYSLDSFISRDRGLGGRVSYRLDYWLSN
jgi:hypothetical protein